MSLGQNLYFNGNLYSERLSLQCGKINCSEAKIKIYFQAKSLQQNPSCVHFWMKSCLNSAYCMKISNSPNAFVIIF